MSEPHPSNSQATQDPQQLAPTYSPKSVEPAMEAKWDAAGAFHAEPTPGSAEGDPSERGTTFGGGTPGGPYSIVIPPPNVTAALHLGHALNNTIQDILIRSHRMMGFNAVWLPGTDHAGIATQTVVDKRLQAEGKPALKDYKKRELEGENGRDEFVGKVRAWKDEYEQTITNQLRRMGCSCDWDRQRFTMDPQCARAVREAFFQLFKDGLIYRGKRLVNWDPVSQTALADDEVEMRPVDGSFWYLKYPIVRRKSNVKPAGAEGSGGISGLNQDDFEATGEYATVATTRPETMLGDTAVAVNPDDAPRAKYIGQFVKLPIVGRIIPILGDDYVIKPDPDSEDPMARMASGFLKVTPAHDPNDYLIGQRHDLPIINVMALDASISKDHGWADFDQCDAAAIQPLLGLSREDARRAIVRWFKDHELLQDRKPHRHSVGHSYRSHVPIEPYLSDQWYVKVTDDRLAGEALRALHPSQRQPASTEFGQQSFDNEPLHAAAAAEREDVSRGQAAGGNDEDDRDRVAGYDGAHLRFHPARYAKTYQTWHENIRDWCISRQLWWGHRIPVWRAANEQAGKPTAGQPWAWDDPRVAVHADDHTQYVCLREDDPALIAKLEAAGFTQDPDVLDTWFSSALWPMSTLGWPEGADALRTWNPTSVLCTAREIITLWVSRMVMFNRYFSDPPRGPAPRKGEDVDRDLHRAFRGGLGPQVPFHDVFIHAMIQDGHGQKMSKSLGNGVDPMDIIHSHGADAMRFTLASMTTHTQDVKLPVDMVDPHTNETFQPDTITTKQGYKVAAPIQERPPGSGKKMVSSYGLTSGEATPTDEMPLARNTSEKFDLGQRFANKMWNAVRFALDNLNGFEPTGAEGSGGISRSSSATVGTNPHDQDAPDSDPSISHPPSDISHQLTLPDRWILHRLCETIDAIDDALESYEFARFATALYDFFWRDLCDWYIEAVKPTVRENPAQRAVLAACLDAAMRLGHPVMPFITERLFDALNQTVPGDRSVPGLALPPADLLARAPWPKADVARLKDDDAAERWAQVQGIVGAIREVRATHKVPPRQAVDVSARAPAAICQQLLGTRDLVATLARMDGGEVGPHIEPPAAAAATRVGDIELFIHDVVDPDAERDRLTKRRDELAKSIKTMDGRLSNEKYVSKAPAHLVQETRDQLAEARRELADVEGQLAALA